MRTFISISDEDELKRGALLSLNINFPIERVPLQLANGDTFVLSIIGEGVRLHRKHWDVAENRCTLMCFGRRELLLKLKRMGEMVSGSGGTAFSLSPQVWE